MNDPLRAVKRLFGVKDDEQIRREVEREPSMRRAQRSFDKGEAVLAELEALERRRSRR
jgi:hypothetical protein